MCLFEEEKPTPSLQGCHVGATPLGMKKDRIGENASIAHELRNEVVGNEA